MPYQRMLTAPGDATVQFGQDENRFTVIRPRGDTGRRAFFEKKDADKVALNAGLLKLQGIAPDERELSEESLSHIPPGRVQAFIKKLNQALAENRWDNEDSLDLTPEFTVFTKRSKETGWVWTVKEKDFLVVKNLIHRGATLRIYHPASAKGGVHNPRYLEQEGSGARLAERNEDEPAAPFGGLADRDLEALREKMMGVPTEVKSHDSEMIVTLVEPAEKLSAKAIEKPEPLFKARQAISFSELLESFLVQAALANELKLAREDSLPEHVAVLLDYNAPASTFGLKLKKDGNRLVLEVTQESKGPLFIDVKKVIADSKGHLKAAVVKTSDLINLVKMKDETIKNLLEQVPGTDFTKPVLIHTHLDIFGDIAKDTTYFDLFVMQAYMAERTNRRFMESTSFAMEGTKENLSMAGARLAELEKQHDLEGKLTILFTTTTNPEVSHVHLVPADIPNNLQTNHRYLPFARPQTGDIVSYMGPVMYLGPVVARIKISDDESIDPRVKEAYEIYSGKIEGRILKTILKGLADVPTLMKHALKALARVDFQAIYQWAKNMLAVARAA